MANLYGVANAPGLPLLTGNFPTSDTVCTANVFTTIYTSPPLVAPSQGYFYAMVFVCLQVQTGATIPAGVLFGVAIGAGSVTNIVSYATYPMAVSTSYYVPFYTFTPVSQSAWQGAGSTISLAFQPSTNNANVLHNSEGIITLLRAPDQ